MASPDLMIIDIVNVYHTCTSRWAMPQPVNRAVSGLVYFVQGSITYHFEQGDHTAVPGDVLVLPQGVRYCGEKQTEELEFHVIDFVAAPVEGLAGLELPPVVPAGERAARLFSRCGMEWNSGSLATRLLCRSTVYAILAELVGRNAQHITTSVQVEHILSHLRSCYCDPSLRITDLSERFHLSASQIRRLFQSALHMSPVQYITMQRLELAQNLLRHECLSVKEVAFRCGFASEYYFSRVFKTHVGVPPSQFR